MLRRSLATIALLSALVACRGLLGISDPDDSATNGEDSGASTDDGTVARDGAATSDGGDGAEGVVDAGSRKEQLAALRVRIADGRPTDQYFTSRTWLYWNDELAKGHAYRLTDATTRTFARRVDGANDTHYVFRTPNDATIYTADGEQSQGVYPWDVYPTATSDGVVFLMSEGANHDALVWRPNGPASLPAIGALTTTVALLVGRDDHRVFVHDYVTKTRLWIVDLANSNVGSMTIDVSPQSVAALPDDAMVLSHFAGEKRFSLQKTGQSAIDLTAAIKTAASDVPPPMRTAFGDAVTYGAWVLFSANCGILAYRHSDAKLVVVQERTTEDSLFFNGLNVASAAKALVFTIGNAKPTPDALPGLYSVPLDAILPP